MRTAEWVMILVLGMFWGSSFIFIEILIQEMATVMMVFLRVSLAAAVLFLLIVLQGKPVKLTLKEIGAMAFMGLFSNAIPFFLFALGQHDTTAGLASIINASTAIFGIILGAILFKEVLTLSRSLGVLLGITGISIAIGAEHLVGLFNGSLGPLYMLMATFLYAATAFFSKRFLSHLPSLTLACGMLTSSSIILLPFVWFDLPSLVELPFDIWVIAFSFAMTGSVIGFILYFKLLEVTDASNVMFCTLIIAPSTIIMEAIFLGHWFTLSQGIGVLTTTLGLLIIDGRILRYFFGSTPTSS